MPASTTIWTSQLVEQTLERYRLGIPTNLECFYHSDIELKAENLLYKLTQDEIDEFHKCSQDIVYFVEKYCRFLTDAGRRTVKLRNYQVKILEALAKEKYDETRNELFPVIRNLIMMQSRQSGKCLFNGDIIIQWPDKSLYKVPIQLFYYMMKKEHTLLEKIKIKLLMAYYKLSIDE